MHATERPYVTEAEFLRGTPWDPFVELLDGEIVPLTPSPSIRHGMVQVRVFDQLRAWAARATGTYTIVPAPLDVWFGPDRILQPDLIVFEGRLDPDGPVPVRRLPVLCVEVLSTNAHYDRHTKRLVYGAAGVPEYWVVDPMGGAERFTGPGLVAREATADRLVSATLDGLVVDVGPLPDDAPG